MKRGLILFGLILVFSLYLTQNSLASTVDSPCKLYPVLVNQDPYPAVPGEYIEVLFQINGVGTQCYNGATANLVLDYPFSLDVDDSSTRSMKYSTYVGQGYNPNWNMLYKLRVDENALEGDYELELRFSEGSYLDGSYESKRFNISIEDGRTDFELHIEDYNIKDKSLEFEILNIGNQDISALTLEIPKQQNVVIAGSNRNIVGDLDSNEYTTASFEATPQEGEMLVKLSYTDAINERRTIEKTIYYDPSYFINAIENQTQSPLPTYIVMGVVFVAIVTFIVLRKKKNNKTKRRKKFKI